MKLRSKFRIAKVDEMIIFLIDEDESLSMTNDAEAVCEFVQDSYAGRRIIYCDTEGSWSEMVHEAGRFKGFAAYRGAHPST